MEGGNLMSLATRAEISGPDRVNSSASSVSQRPRPAGSRLRSARDDIPAVAATADVDAQGADRTARTAATSQTMPINVRRAPQPLRRRPNTTLARTAETISDAFVAASLRNHQVDQSAPRTRRDEHTAPDAGSCARSGIVRR